MKTIEQLIINSAYNTGYKFSEVPFTLEEIDEFAFNYYKPGSPVLRVELYVKEFKGIGKNNVPLTGEILDYIRLF